MFDREKTETQSDIEFDFFDESPTAESAPRRGMSLPRRRGPKRPPAPPGGQQLYRLGVLIAGAIVLAVILILVVQSCRSSQKQSEYEGYVDDVSGIASASEELGAQLNTSLTTPGITLEDLRGDVEGLRDQQEQLLRTAQELQPPGPLLEQQESLVDAMQFRVNGLDGLATALTQVAQSSNAEETGADLAEQAQRLMASDIVYADAFQQPTATVLDEEGIGDVAVPGSQFVKNPEFSSPTAWNLIVERLTQSPQAGGLHGNGIQTVRWLPAGEQLSATEDNTVVASDRLAFEVVVENSGESQETQVRVRLVIQQNPEIRQEQTIDLINPGETRTVRFSDINNVTFSTRTTLLVNVEPVPGETNEGNNSAQYRVIFTLG